MKKWLILLMLALPINAQAFNLGFNMGFGGNSSGRLVDIISTLSWSPTSKAFGDVNTGATSDQIFTLLCTADAGDCEDITTSATGTGFSINATTCAAAPFTLLTGESCTATARFAPLAAGAATGSLTAAWVNRDDVTATLTGAGISGYLVSEDFTSGVRPVDANGVVWTDGGDGAYRPNYAYTPALEGAYSLSIGTNSRWWQAAFAAQSDVYVAAKLRITNLDGAVLYLGGTSGSQLYISGGGVWLLKATGAGAWASGGTYTAGTPVFVKIRYTTATNTATLWISTTGQTGTWTQVAQSVGVGGVDVANIRSSAPSSNAIIYDDVRASTTDINY